MQCRSYNVDVVRVRLLVCRAFPLPSHLLQTSPENQKCKVVLLIFHQPQHFLSCTPGELGGPTKLFLKLVALRTFIPINAEQPRKKNVFRKGLLTVGLC